MKNKTIDKTYSLYSLNCPVNGEMRYIGISCRVKSRFSQHCTERHMNAPKPKWIKHLYDADLKPILNIIESGLTLDEATSKEKSLINRCFKEGMLLYNSSYYRAESEVFNFLVDEDLHKKVRIKCAENDITLTKLITDFLIKFTNG